MSKGEDEDEQRRGGRREGRLGKNEGERRKGGTKVRGAGEE